jgi:hypothetical protein
MKRLVLAILATLAAAFLLSLLSSYATQGVAPASATPWGYTDPLSCLVISVAHCIGGVIAGRRFIPVALAVMAVSWAGSLYLLTRIAAPVSLDPFAAALSNNGLQMALSTLAALAGAAIGAWWHSSRAQTQTG